LVETLPQLTYGRIVGRFLAAVGDGTDADLYPDEVPLSGTVTFTPSASTIVIATATPDPVTVFPNPITATLDSAGYITDPSGNRGIYLIATDNPATNPTNFTYNVSIKVALGNGAPYSATSKDIAVAAGSITDLINAVSVPASGGTGGTGPVVGTGGAVASVNGKTGIVVINKADVGLGVVTNTADADKPVSTPQRTALNLKADTFSPTFTGTVSGITAPMVGLPNVNNTSDIDKPISTATAAALATKYTKPSGGIDTGDLSSNVVAKLNALPPTANGVFVVLQQVDGTYPTYTAPAGQLILFVGTAQPDPSVRKPTAWIQGAVT
jgi:hypothetical protein